MRRALVVSEGPHDAAVDELVRRLFEQGVHIEHDRVSSPDIHAYHGIGPGFFKRAVRWILEAERRGYDALILVIDRDGDKRRTAQFDEAQKYVASRLPRALGVAIESFDAWILTDEKALSEVLKIPVPKQKDPESIQQPKLVCETLISASSVNLSQRDVYRAVCRVVDLKTLERRCKKGFAPFAKRLSALEII